MASFCIRHIMCMCSYVFWIICYRGFLVYYYVINTIELLSLCLAVLIWNFLVKFVLFSRVHNIILFYFTILVSSISIMITFSTYAIYYYIAAHLVQTINNIVRSSAWYKHINVCIYAYIHSNSVYDVHSVVRCYNIT